jgi:hypothetical protein
MKKNKVLKKKNQLSSLLSEVIDIEKRINKLPDLLPLKRAKFEHGMALDHLYYSSKIEGTHLSEKRLEKVIYGEGISTSSR